MRTLQLITIIRRRVVRGRYHYALAGFQLQYAKRYHRRADKAFCQQYLYTVGTQYFSSCGSEQFPSETAIVPYNYGRVFKSRQQPFGLSAGNARHIVHSEILRYDGSPTIRPELDLISYHNEISG